MKTILIFGIIFIAIAAWFLISNVSAPESEIIAKNGLHWHSNLTINIFGENQDIPAGIGLERLPHNPMHTHDRDNVIHMEFSGRVEEDDLRLVRFFEIWGKTFNKDCIFDKCSDLNNQLTMLINGEKNLEFENYIMRDGDKIKIIFEALSEKTSQIKEIFVTGTEFSFSPASISVKAGEKIKLTFQNQGGASHNLIIEGLGIGTKIIGSGKTDAIEFTAPAPGNYNFLCSIPGHRASGMEGKIIVE